MGKIRTQSERRALVNEWRCSGLSAKEFGSRRSVSVSSLHRWQTELGSAPSPRSAESMSTFEPTSARFVVVEPSVTETPDAPSPPTLRVELGGLHLRLWGFRVELGALHLRLGDRPATSWLAELTQRFRG